MPILTDGRVLPYRTEPTLDEVLVGDPVRAGTWADVAKLIHWVRGRGRVLLPQHAPRTSLSSGSATHRYKVRPSGPAIARVWVGEVRSSVPLSAFTLKAGSSPTTGTLYASSAARFTLPFVYLETGVTKTTNPTDLTFLFSWVDGTPVLETLACWELPRAALARSSDDLGISLDSLYPRRPIFEATYEGPSAVAASVLGTSTRRVGLWAWWNATGAVFSSTSFVSLWVAGMPLVPAKDRPADTTREAEWYVYASMSDGTTAAQIQVVDASAVASTALVLAAGTQAAQWRGAGTKKFLCEDLTTADGVPSGGPDTVQLQVKRTAGSGTITVYGTTGYEALP